MRIRRLTLWFLRYYAALAPQLPTHVRDVYIGVRETGEPGRSSFFLSHDRCVERLFFGPWVAFGSTCLFSHNRGCSMFVCGLRLEWSDNSCRISHTDAGCLPGAKASIESYRGEGCRRVLGASALKCMVAFGSRGFLSWSTKIAHLAYFVLISNLSS